MKKYYRKLEKVSNVLEYIPHSHSQGLATAIRVCNDIAVQTME